MDPELPLAGLRVVDAATYIAAPAAAAVLASFGAEVIKVERPPHGDPFRYLHLMPGMPSSPLAYPFLADNRNKRAIALNLSLASGREAFLRLAARADVVITNYQPQMLERFRIRYEDLAPENPRLIHASITGYGEQGAEAEKPGYDMTAYYARSGLMSYLHNSDAEPCLSPCGFGDHPSAMSLVAGIFLALYRRERTGKGGRVTTTLMHNGVWSNASLVQGALAGATFAGKWSRRNPPNPLVNHYAASDSRRFLFCLLDPAKDWPNLCRAIGRTELETQFPTTESRREHAAALVAILDEAFAALPLSEWTARFDRHDLLYGIVPGTEEVAGDETMQANGVFTPVDGTELRTIEAPFRLEGAGKVAATMAPRVGEHTTAVLAELGYGPAEQAALRETGAAFAP